MFLHGVYYGSVVGVAEMDSNQSCGCFWVRWLVITVVDVSALGG